MSRHALPEGVRAPAIGTVWWSHSSNAWLRQYGTARWHNQIVAIPEGYYHPVDVVSGAPWIIGYDDGSGQIRTEEVSEVDYLNLLAGNGAKQKVTPRYTVLEVFDGLAKLWDERPCPFDLLPGEGCTEGCPCGSQS